jgi:hypothetical protein
LYLWNNNISDEWVKALVEAIENTGWLKEWSELDLQNNQLWDEWKTILKKLNDDTRANWIKCKIYF